jgi:hypothetical protein
MRRRGGGCSRREFLGRAAQATAGLLALGGAGVAAAQGAGTEARGAAADGRVGIARCPRVLDEGAVDAELVGEMADRAVMWLTRLDDADRAWASLFSSDEVVGIKPNGLGGIESSTAPELIAHCIERLHGLGVKPENVLLWEDRPSNLLACGLSPDEPTLGARSYVIHGDLSDPITEGSLTDRWFRPLVEGVDAILNLPILKAHPICGVTLAMKNHYGSIAEPAKQHFDQCHTPLVDMTAMPLLREKTRLVLCDGTRARIEGQAYGEAQYWPSIVMAATDVVAHDAVGARIIAEERERRGMRTLAAEGLEPRYIAMAGERGLGVADLDAIEIELIELP